MPSYYLFPALHGVMQHKRCLGTGQPKDDSNCCHRYFKYQLRVTGLTQTLQKRWKKNYNPQKINITLAAHEHVNYHKATTLGPVVRTVICVLSINVKLLLKKKNKQTKLLPWAQLFERRLANPRLTVSRGFYFSCLKNVFKKKLSWR